MDEGGMDVEEGRMGWMDGYGWVWMGMDGYERGGRRRRRGNLVEQDDYV